MSFLKKIVKHLKQSLRSFSLTIKHKVEESFFFSAKKIVFL